MKNYQVILTGNRTITVDEKEAEVIKSNWLGKTKAIININRNTIDTSTIKGIFEINEEQYGLDQSIGIINRDFSMDCFNMASLPIEDKIFKELSIRVFPQKFLDKDWINYSADLADKIKIKVKSFFEANPKMPRCPSKYWWPILKPMIRNKRIASFYKLVMRNDNVIIDWAKWNNIKINEPNLKLI